MEWYKAESNVAPAIVDATSSPTTVFVRQNIEQKEVEDEEGNKQIVFTYEERKLSKEEYALEVALKGNANVEFLMMMNEGEFDE